MGITKVFFYSSATDGEKVILKECTGPEAEETADLFLRNLIFTAKQQPSHQMEMVVTLKDGNSWETGFDLEYTYLTDTVRSLVIRSAQMETFYGDEPQEGCKFIEAINKPTRKSKYGNKETRIGPMFFDVTKVTPEEIAKTMFTEIQWKKRAFSIAASCRFIQEET